MAHLHQLNIADIMHKELYVFLYTPRK